MVGSINVTEAVGRYAATLKGDDKQAHQQELNRFVRWFDGRMTADMSAQEVERFQEDFERTGADSRRLEPVKQFLAWAQKQGMTDINYGKFIRIRRAGARSARGGGRTIQIEQPTGEMLTAEGFTRLQDELDDLINVKRPEIARELFEARIDKDFRENAPYDAAKHHQAEVEARIRQLQSVLARAQIIDEKAGGPRGGKIKLGAKMTLRDMEHDEELHYTLVSPNEANPGSGRISVASPVGRALLDRLAGETIEVETPGGSLQYRIEKVE
jgi:transcription elongation factor GreA